MHYMIFPGASFRQLSTVYNNPCNPVDSLEAEQLEKKCFQWFIQHVGESVRVFHKSGSYGCVKINEMTHARMLYKWQENEPIWFLD